MLDYNDTIRLAVALSKYAKDYVAIFRDNGWGDDPGSRSVYDIIVDGHGQNPFGEISKDTFEKLHEKGIIEDNTYGGFKDRGVHEFKKEILSSSEWWKQLESKTNEKGEKV